MLDWAHAPGPKDYELPGRSLSPILSQEKPAGWDRICASHGFHEIQQYPMRALRTREYKYIVNLAHALAFPIAGDIASSPSWQAIERKPSLGLGSRPLAAFLHRPREELYELTQDPNEVKNLAGDAKYRDVLERTREEMEKFRAETRDPWLPGQIAVHGHGAH